MEYMIHSQETTDQCREIKGRCPETKITKGEAERRDQKYRHQSAGPCSQQTQTGISLVALHLRLTCLSSAARGLRLPWGQLCAPKQPQSPMSNAAAPFLGTRHMPNPI